MALDRQSISRRDFPTARRGYEPGAVDAHLAAIADEVEALRRTAGPGATLATHTSDQVRTIIEAAETSAAGIREAAAAEAREHVARTAAAADALQERIDGLERALGELVGGLRAEAERLRAELADVVGAAGALGAVAGAPAAPAAGAPAAPPEIAPAALGATVGAADGAAADEGEVDEEPAGAAIGEERSADVEGARIVALESALAGRPRDETDRYLAEHYDLPDRAGLLAEVYALAPQD